MSKLIPYAFLFVGLILAALAGPSQVETLMLSERTDRFVETEARVLRRWTQEHKQGPSTEMVEFEYVVDGEEYEGDNHLTMFGDSARELDDAIRREDGWKVIDVYYDPEEPERVVVHRDIDIVPPLAILGGTLACIIAGLVALFGGGESVWEREQRERQSFRETRTNRDDA